MTNEISEAQTRRDLIDQALSKAGWDNPPHSVTPEETITDGRIIPLGQKKATRKDGLRADYVLRYNRDFKIAVVEAKKKKHTRRRWPTTSPRLRRNVGRQICLCDQRHRHY